MECQIIKMEGKMDRQSRLLAAFKNYAERQRNAYVDIFPWQMQMRNSMVMFVAANNLRGLRGACTPTAETKICGWLTAFLEEKGGQRVIYLAEISSRSATNASPVFKGIGKKLFDALLQWAKEKNVQFIYLYPLNEKVKALYERWGLAQEAYNARGQDMSKYMFYKLDLAASPSPSFLAKLKQTQTSAEVTEIDVLADYLTNAQIQFMRRLESTDKDLYDVISKELQTVIQMCDNEDELDQGIMEIIQQYNSIPKQGGKRKRT